MTFPAGDSPFRALRIRRVVLADFRSYAALDLRLSANIAALAGENGAGKTNLLEAISLFTPGRGLRRAELADLAREGGGGGFAVSLELTGEAGGPLQLGTGAEMAPEGAQKKYRIDREPVSSSRAFADHVRIVWLTPAMDGLFAGPAGERRRFLDRLVLAVDSEHGARVGALERALRNRNKLLEERRGEKIWLDAAEREIAELGIAVAAARRETVERLAALIAAGRDAESPFPWADIALEGEIDRLTAERPALEAEEMFRVLLRDNRARDAAAGRSLIGPQASDLIVRHGPKQCDARRASTGEQKALLVGLVLAHAQLVAAMSGIAPLVLLDEIAAHFDPRRRRALFDALAALGGQIWMTGADASLFDDLIGRADIFTVCNGSLSPLSRAEAP
ncbi:DNA replication/repair protein RecF [Rhodoblastus acidophilus]|uniref:DNA replication and repair protein RecF n=1 Tax=Candidatus Rhodoblastus alkanivorans TaxID=2954117 RepID=A0ABS9ZAX2_9HYPH|nr:DNA replication/repair protein RecF [Candidatus Rhodoblastus alkanivorans]MCI4679373.1 DNA replication/repair protein RecF [Candidatus Rhodoblastus alkanivorans]MCI4684849.1 DNA replication/repair protein RecF [Candidatus Rhodoblastus alkanivorans]MDI4642173.1 DNA replication/repair protein RecF [Rhodoblastus acidophilus]